MAVSIAYSHYKVVNYAIISMTMSSIDKWGRDRWEVEKEKEEMMWDRYVLAEEREWEKRHGKWESEENGFGKLDLAGKIIWTVVLSACSYFSTAFIIDQFNSAKAHLVDNVSFLVVPGFFISTLLLIWLGKIPFIGKLLKIVSIGCLLLTFIFLAIYFSISFF
jgi:ABC-type multidrug transport system permease subunit